ncbi:MAG: NAD(P)-dependent dehydrogenase, short-chain alcohol dehydrogenase family [Chloroflexi bacterium]|nr:MAG: NAD(P)-dependent dehydrogenase, short-chain alcohol dehydrogenase family [Chloroflexota bacterium]
MGRLDDRVCVITGAGRGIGSSLARTLAAQGGKIVVNDLGGAIDGSGSDQTPAQQVVDEITAAGGQAVANYADVSDYAQAEGLVQQALDTYGGLDVLINVAGILRDRMLFNMNEKEWDDVIRVHMKGTFNTSKFASIHWRSERKGHYRLINFTSVSGLYGNPGQPNYSAAKMGIVGFTLSSANALARYGATANAISPGAQTRMIDDIPPERRRAGLAAAQDDKRSPDNIAPPVVYLASEDSDWLSGRVIGARGYEIELVRNPVTEATLYSDKMWGIDEACEEMERVFKPMVEGRTSMMPRPYAHEQE